VAGGVDPAPARLVFSRAASVVATAVGVHLLMAVAVVEDRRAPAPSRRSVAEASPTPAPVPSRSPEQITPTQGATRRRVAVNTARFTAGQVCQDATSFVYDVVESTSDAIETFVRAHDPAGESGILVKVTLLPGGIAYLVVEESGDCDA